MLRTVADQPTLWEAILPEELRRLPEELARVDAWLDDPVFFTPFASSRGQDDGDSEGRRRQPRSSWSEALSSPQRPSEADIQPSRIRRLAYKNARTFRAPSPRFGGAD
jgi:hypothetical protein